MRQPRRRKNQLAMIPPGIIPPLLEKCIPALFRCNDFTLESFD
ncbi:hypothetical protein CSB93_3476 [Pseudomonas paraeruginosa]|uniref:Uncharacterized protein n=1 Tax=Pseudomonas paraeruginosa TaxID=2994495 RepID=A0A2R3IT69_9PSED|nr:hypothetical protein CSB93_3476 [Pseudomonas paraeruginosa]